MREILNNKIQKMKKALLLFSFAIVLSCTQEISPVETIDVERGIDLKRNVDFVEFAKDVSFVAFENAGKQSLIGDIYLLKEHENSYYVCADNTIISYNKQGKFQRHYGVPGRGPKEYVGYISDFDIKAGDLYIIANSKIHCYDTLNTFLFRDSVNFAQILILNNKIIGVVKPSDVICSDNHEIVKIYDDKIKEIGSISIKGSNDSILTDVKQFLAFQPFSNDGCSGLYIKEFLRDTVYNIASDFKIVPRFVLKMGKYTFPIEMYDFEKMDKWDDYYIVNNMFNAEKYMILSLQNGLMGKVQYLLYDKDSKDCFTPTDQYGNQGFYVDGVKFKPLYIRNNRIVGYINPEDIVDQENFKLKELQIIRNGIKLESNPILVIITL